MISIKSADHIRSLYSLSLTLLVYNFSKNTSCKLYNTWRTGLVKIKHFYSSSMNVSKSGRGIPGCRNAEPSSIHFFFGTRKHLVVRHFVKRRPLIVANHGMVTAIFAPLSLRIVFKHPSVLSKKKLILYIAARQPKSQTWHVIYSSFFFLVVEISNSQEEDNPSLSSKVVASYRDSGPEPMRAWGWLGRPGTGGPRLLYGKPSPDFTLHRSNTQRRALWVCYCIAPVRYGDDQA